MTPEKTMTIDDVVGELGVSSASVRNWIKTGYLKCDNGRQIYRDSYNSFCANIVGSEKLNKRANKSKVDFHNHVGLAAAFFSRVLEESIPDLDTIGSEYENSLSDAYRNKEGIYYTPIEIINRFFQYLPKNVSTLKFCDPCCGSGNFIAAALDYGFLPENIFGFDIDPVAVEIARARFKSRTKMDGNNIKHGDFLTHCLQGNENGILYDAILTNPPWGKKLDLSQKKDFATFWNLSGSPDTSALFFHAAFNKANTGAVIGMLLPDAFFNISSFSATRKFVLRNKMLGCIDFGKPFDGLLTKAKGLLVKNEAFDGDRNLVECETLGGQHQRNQIDFISNPKQIFNFTSHPSETTIIKKIFQVPHVTLAGNAKWGLGIVTGNNGKLVAHQPQSDYIPVYKGTDINSGSINKPKHFIPKDMSLFQQVAPLEIYFAPEKLVYRFISSKLVFYHDKSQSLFLNSANMLVVKDGFDVDSYKIAWLFNTDLMSWLFSKLFETHKILRSDLEVLPIFNGFLNTTNNPTEDKLLNYLDLFKEENGTYRLKA